MNGKRGRIAGVLPKRALKIPPLVAKNRREMKIDGDIFATDREQVTSYRGNIESKIIATEVLIVIGCF